MGIPLKTRLMQVLFLEQFLDFLGFQGEKYLDKYMIVSRLTFVNTIIVLAQKAFGTNSCRLTAPFCET